MMTPSTKAIKDPVYDLSNDWPGLNGHPVFVPEEVE